MKIQFITPLKVGLGTLAVATTMAFTPLVNSSAKAHSMQNTSDTFEYVTKKAPDGVLLPPPAGSSSEEILAFAPDPSVKVMGKNKKATFVVDLTNNVLYHYNKQGEPICAYRVASGRNNPEDRTDEGLRIVSHVETYPYRKAPAHTKRHKQPHLFGPKIIILDTLNPRNGKRGSTGEFIHGNCDESSLGKHASGGCIRMDNTVIKELARVAKRGDIVVMMRRAQ